MRSNLPTGRFNPNDATGAAFGSGVARGLQALGSEGEQAVEVMHELEKARLREQVQTQQFQRETALLDMAASERDRLETEARDIKGDGSGFTEDYLSRFDERAAAFMADVPEARQDEWRTNVARLRSSLAGDVLRREFAIRDSFFGNELDTALQNGLSVIGSNPDQAEATRQQLLSSIDASLLPEDEKARRRAAVDQQTAFAYGAALGERDPAALIRALGGRVTGAGEYRVDGARNANEQQAVGFFQSQGLNPYAVAGLTAVLSWEGAGMNPRARNPGDGSDGSDSIGIGQWNGPRATALKEFARSKGKAWTDLGVQLEFVLHEMKTGGPMEREAYRRLQGAQSLEDAVEAMSYYERPQGWRAGGDRTAVIHWRERVARASQIAGTRAEADDPLPAGVDPTLARLKFEDRIRLRGFADKSIADAERAAEAQRRADQAERVNALELAVMDGTKGQADIDAARREGWLDDAGDVSRLQGIVNQRTKVDDDFQAWVTATGMGPLFQWNAFDSEHRDIVEAGVKAMGGTPQAAFDQWQRTGILADVGAARIRSGLASTDPARVREAATIAARMLQRSPAAFQGAEGANEIETAALLYARRLELGDTEEQAAQRVAQSNDPAYRSRVKVADEDAKAFRDRMRKEDPTPQILKALGAEPGLFRPGALLGQGAQERAAILQDYAELASDHYSQYGDADAAKAFALNRMRAMYGRSRAISFRDGRTGERLMRYPPESVYPTVNGDHNWLYRQAAADIKKATGRTISPENIMFVPIPGLTADAWRARRPAPYTIQYADVVNGQRVIRTLNGSAFVGAPPRSTTSDARRRAFEAERARRDAAARRDFERATRPEQHPGAY